MAPLAALLLLAVTPRAEPHALRVDLAWSAAPGATFEVQCAATPAGPFQSLPNPCPRLPAFSDFRGPESGPRTYRVRAAGGEWSAPVTAAPLPLDPGALPEEAARAAFRYFWDYGHPVSGLAREALQRHPDVCAIGASGMGLANLIVGAERGWISRAEAAARVQTMLSFLAERAERFHGAWPHWINGSTGQVIPFSPLDDGADLVETGFLMQGVRLARWYFDRDDPAESALRARADELWGSVEWDWFAQPRGGHEVLMWHWSPRHGFARNMGITGFNECQIVYLLALASPTHAIGRECYRQGWLAPDYGQRRRRLGLDLELGRGFGPPLFWCHYSYLGLDPHALRYHGRSYFDHFRDLARAQVLYCDAQRERFKGYGEAWGLSACLGPDGYRAYAPGSGDDGTLAPTAALASMPYVPEDSRACLRALYEQHGPELWGPFGFWDAFNPTRGWAAKDYLGIDQGPIAPMIENWRSGLLWRTLAKDPALAAVVAGLGDDGG
jgi:hypothetical protein